MSSQDYTAHGQAQTVGLTPATLDTTVICPVGAGQTVQVTVKAIDVASTKTGGGVYLVAVQNVTGSPTIVGGRSYGDHASDP